jgi:hypothetical protein
MFMAKGDIAPQKAAGYIALQILGGLAALGVFKALS